MGELVTLIYEIKKDKNNFNFLLERMEPAVNKYVRLLYKDEKEDIRSELMLALWEAIGNIEYCESDGQVLNFLNTALRNRFYEMYKKSRKKFDHESAVNEETGIFQTILYEGKELEDTIFREDAMKIVGQYKGVQQNIVQCILLKEMTDREIAQKLNLSRQYINRIRRKLKEHLQREDYFV